MSHFLREFETLIDEYQSGSGSAVFKSAGLDPATLSRLRGSGLNIQFENIPQVAAAIGREDSIYLRLLRARLMDECTDPRATRIEIQIKGMAPVTIVHQRDRLTALPPKQEQAIRNIIEVMPLDAGFRSTVLWLGDLASDARQIDVASLNDGDSGYDGSAKAPEPPPSKPRGPVRYRVSSHAAPEKPKTADEAVDKLVKLEMKNRGRRNPGK